jgi:uncharacterized membrane protein YciS (DUF1049 family)
MFILLLALVLNSIALQAVNDECVSKSFWRAK